MKIGTFGLGRNRGGQLGLQHKNAQNINNPKQI
jgi:hypothetical protein